ncbi:hypothetical protein HDU97_002167 [Phlyctochytrium planicorne]|nr:hypothetical protein HDU97_002167 [Phlyctochytrium planicorne]
MIISSDSAVELLPAHAQGSNGNSKLGDVGVPVAVDRTLEGEMEEEREDIAASPSPVFSKHFPEDMTYDDFVVNPLWTATLASSTLPAKKPERTASMTTGTRTRSTSQSTHASVRTRKRGHSTSSTASSYAEKVQGLLAFHTVLEQQPPQTVVGRDRFLKAKPSQLESLQMSLELVLEHRKSKMSLNSKVKGGDSVSEGESDVLDDYYMQDESLSEEKVEEEQEVLTADDSSIMSSDSDDASDMMALDQIAAATLAAAQRTRENAVAMAFRGVGVKDSDVAAAAIASWGGPRKLTEKSSMASLSSIPSISNNTRRGLADRGSASPAPSNSSLSRLSVSLASLSVARGSPSPIPTGQSAVTELMTRLDTFAADMNAMIVELNNIQAMMQDENAANDRLSSAASSQALRNIEMEIFGEDVFPESSPSTIPIPGRISPDDDDNDSIFEMTPKSPRRKSKSGLGKAARMMGMSYREEADMVRMSMLMPTEKRNTLQLSPAAENDSDSDDSILPSSMKKSKRPVSTMKAWKIMGVDGSDQGKTNRSFRPMSVLNPNVNEQTSPATTSQKALKLLGQPASRLQIPQDSSARRKSISRATPSPTNSFSTASFASPNPTNASALNLAQARKNSVISLGSLRNRRPSQATIATSNSSNSLEDIDVVLDDGSVDERDSRRGSTSHRRSKSVNAKAYKIMGMAEPADGAVPGPFAFRRRSSTPSSEDVPEHASRPRSNRMSRIGKRAPSVPPKDSVNSDPNTLGRILQDRANPPAHQGFLQKYSQSKLFKSWKKKYFVLLPTQGKLVYFDSNGSDDTVEGVIPVDLRTDVASARNQQFKGKQVIQISANGEFWYLLAEDEGVKGVWMKALVETLMSVKPGSLSVSSGLGSVPSEAGKSGMPISGRRPSLGLLNLSSFGSSNGNTPSPGRAMVSEPMSYEPSTQSQGLPEFKTLTPIMSSFANLSFENPNGSETTLNNV